MSLNEAQAAELLDEVLFWYFKHGNQNAEQADATLDITVHCTVDKLGFDRIADADDLKACAALAYEQLAAR
jgi:hypothetical protein